MGLKINSLDKLLDIEGSSGISVPYIGYGEVNLKIPKIKAYDENALMMVMNDSKYGDKFSLQLELYIHMQLWK